MFRFVGDLALEASLEDEQTRYALLRCDEILGQAVRHGPDSLRRSHPEIPGAVMSAVCNRIVHGCFGIDDTILFTTIEQDLKPLLPSPDALAHSQDGRVRRMIDLPGPDAAA